jgi:hypothetical protein
MSAKMIIIPQEEADKGFGLLKDIVEMVKNPDAIDKAYQRRLEAVKLTEDEIKKSEEARIVIANAAAIKDQQQQEWARIEATKIEHDGAVKMFGEYVLRGNARFKEWEDRLNEKQKAQDAKDSQHAKERINLDNRAKDIEDNHAEWERTHKADNEALVAAKEATRLEAEKVVVEKAKVKAKAARIAAEAQKDD